MTSPKVQKISRAEQHRLNRLRAQTERKIRRSIDAFLSTTRSDAVTRRVISLLERGAMTELMSLIDSQVVVLGNVIPEAFQDVAKDEAKETVENLQRVIPDAAAVGVSFDPTHPRAATLMRNARMDFIRDYSEKQRAATRQALSRALQTGAGPVQAARAFRDSMGLTEQQLGYIDNYRNLLESNSREALQRDLRDRRFDSTVRRAADDNAPLSQSQIDRMVERYHRRMEIYRSEMIARTETTSILSEAREEARRQAHQQADIPDEWIRRTWNTSMDGRERDTHAAANGQTIKGMNSKYVVGGAHMKHPGDRSAPAREVINCRCDESISYEPPGV